MVRLTGKDGGNSHAQTVLKTHPRPSVHQGALKCTKFNVLLVHYHAPKGIQVQAQALSRREQGFDSPWDYQTNPLRNQGVSCIKSALAGSDFAPCSNGAQKASPACHVPRRTAGHSEQPRSQLGFCAAQAPFHLQDGGPLFPEVFRFLWISPGAPCLQFIV